MLPAFALTLFLSALLLFWVQPMFTKMVLPMLGGTPAVWNTAMLFFQAALLCGYAYAHLTSRLFALRSQVVVHASIVGAAFLLLPISAAAGWTPPIDDTPVFWLIGLMAVSLGLPFFVVSATAPLLQRWFSHTGHRTAGDPYYLYGASNVGSILALLSYPVVFEPTLTVARQSELWAGGYGLLSALVLISAGLMLWGRKSARARAAEVTSAVPAELARPEVNWPIRLRWTALAFVPSSLMLGLTAFVTTDVAAVPLFWVVPLALYLFTFVLTFARVQPLKHAWMLDIQTVLVLMTAVLFAAQLPLVLLSTLHVATFFVCAMVCHGELWRVRPGTRHLTEFYLWMSFGGMLGGVFNAILAPIFFNAVLEYPIALVLACLLRPWSSLGLRWPSRVAVATVIAPTLVAVPVVAIVDLVDIELRLLLAIAVVAILVAVTLAQRRQPLAYAAGVAVVLGAMALSIAGDGTVISRERSFFGVYTVVTLDEDRFLGLINGTTVHGAQHVDPARRGEPLTYYHRDGPVGQVFEALGGVGRPASVGVVGLGVGAIACYRIDGQDWVYYEIDPAVTALARDTRYFDFLARCAPDVPVVHGDARLSLKAEPNGRFDILILDAFASDAIPVHLVTREAVALYLDKLTPDGLLLFHISNRSIELEPMLASLMRDAGLEARIQTHRPSDESRADYAVPSEWVVAARTADALATVDEGAGWRELTSSEDMRPWTDDYSHILGLIKW
ncbi:MAG: fused MFS/spermidine synthase [Inquilinus sp.]|nr:fused MFS/spermidine synthase [Inquilinus sp.]